MTLSILSRRVTTLAAAAALSMVAAVSLWAQPPTDCKATPSATIGAVVKLAGC